MKISFVVPAYNEERNIGRLLQSIHSSMGDIGLKYDIVVVNNESKDNTARIAMDNGANVIDVNGNSISRLRNRGVESTDGDILVFLDGDMELDRTWSDVFIRETIPFLKDNPLSITGSNYKVPGDGNWIEKCWFKPFETQMTPGLPGGHMITTRDAFNSVNGFDENIETNEDTDITLRMKRKGYKVLHNMDLQAVHHGYAKSIVALFRRQLWAGKNSLRFNKKLVMVCTVNIIGLFILLFLRNVESIGFYIVFVLIASSLLSKRRTSRISLPGIFLSSILLYASTISLVNLYFGKSTIKGNRAR